MKYQRLDLAAREEISRGLAQGLSYRRIAKNTGYNVSTISREVGRYTRRRDYRSHGAEKHAQFVAKRRKLGKRKLFLNPKLWELVKGKLADLWSPEQISVYLKKKYKSKEMHISSESIYTYVYVFLRKPLRKEFVNQFRRAHKKRRVRGKEVKPRRKNPLEDMTLIDERPKEVEGRLVPGHWEGDLMIGGTFSRSSLGTLVERTTRYAILVPLKNKSASEVRKAFAKEMKKLPQSLRRSLTYDQGREMAEHKMFTKETKIKVYFAHPSSPWERGTNENTNGLIRQYFPRGTNFGLLTRAEIKRVQRSLNGRPRKTLGYRTPAEALRKLLR